MRPPKNCQVKSSSHAIPGDINLGAMNRGELEALRRNLKTAQANASAVMPRYTVLLKTEHDAIEKGALALHADKETHDRLMEVVDRRQAAMAAFTAKMMAARAEFYRAYEGYVGVIASEFGTYKVVDGQFIFPLQRTVDRYNVAAVSHDRRYQTRRRAGRGTKRLAEIAAGRLGPTRQRQMTRR